MSTQTHRRVMTITHREFLRSLGPLERHYQIDINDDLHNIVITVGSGEVRIGLGPQNVRKIANLRLPTIDVEFTLSGLNDAEVDLFWSRFDLCFRRGGG
jgi:hypothetical protein